MSRSFAATAVVTLYILGWYGSGLLSWTKEATISHQLSFSSSFNPVRSRLRCYRRFGNGCCMVRLGMNLYVRSQVLWKWGYIPCSFAVVLAHFVLMFHHLFSDNLIANYYSRFPVIRKVRSNTTCATSETQLKQMFSEYMEYLKLLWQKMNPSLVKEICSLCKPIPLWLHHV